MFPYDEDEFPHDIKAVSKGRIKLTRRNFIIFPQFSLHDKTLSICLDISIVINPNIHYGEYMSLCLKPE